MLDKDMREPLFDYLDETYGKNRIIEEKTMGRSRADVIMILEDSVIGFEIKSDSDTYERLKRQARDYNKYCDYNYVVVGKSHSKHVQEHIQKTWGIICIRDDNEDKVEVELLREALPNKKCKISNQIKWLWRLELCNILSKNHLPKYKQKSKKFVQEKIIEKIDEIELKGQICEELFERDYTLVDEKINEYKEKNR